MCPRFESQYLGICFLRCEVSELWSFLSHSLSLKYLCSVSWYKVVGFNEGFLFQNLSLKNFVVYVQECDVSTKSLRSMSQLCISQRYLEIYFSRLLFLHSLRLCVPRHEVRWWGSVFGSEVSQLLKHVSIFEPEGVCSRWSLKSLEVYVVKFKSVRYLWVMFRVWSI